MMRVGVLVGLSEDADRAVAAIHDLGITSCQICNWNRAIETDRMAEAWLAALAKYGVSVSSYWAGWSGPAVWNFTEGPLTLGLLPPVFRHKRVQELKAGADFAKKLGLKQVATHAGFIPENPHDPLYAGMIDALREVAIHLEANGQCLLFETGQETPVTLLRAMSDIGAGNLGVNFDTANLILYGKANPVDALDVIGEYVMDLHIKDGLYPTDGWRLGHEVAAGEGKADFPRIVARLRELGYDGALTIEREISGPKQTEDILSAKRMLEALI